MEKGRLYKIKHYEKCTTFIYFANMITLEGYMIIKKIGSGGMGDGMGDVYLGDIIDNK